jgi:hypothetical protein
MHSRLSVGCLGIALSRILLIIGKCATARYTERRLSKISASLFLEWRFYGVLEKVLRITVQGNSQGEKA